jgi:serine/threonine-protein kinase
MKQEEIAAATWARASVLFDTALDLPEVERAAWLEEIERSEPQVAPWLRRLLAAHAERHTSDWLEQGPALDLSPLLAPAAWGPGSRFGPWRMLERLGQGGMAEVWRAERADGAYERQVALKLPTSWRPDRAGAQRFERERDILARLEHPHIAPLYDAGIADDGTPWLALAWVQGQPIDRHAAQAALPVSARVDLMLQVLDAVHHAHTRLIIHRDLKPSNVMVNERGEVQLLDFGIAKLLGGDDEHAHDTALTRAGGRPLTPAYAAPEQVRGEPLGTASDVYSAGVLLFELLTGRLPYRVLQPTAAQLEQAITMGDVVTASAACSDAATRRMLRGDLDAVLARALQTDPARRYASADALAADLRRWRAGERVHAQTDTLGYRLRKFVARNRLAVGAAAAVAASLLVGLGVALWQAERAAHERDRALQARFTSEAVNFFLNDLLVEAARSDAPVTVPQLLARGEAMARATLARQPANLGMVLHIIGSHRAEVDSPEAGRRLMAEALTLVRDDELRRDIECEDASWQGRQGEVDAAMQRLSSIGEDVSVRPITRALCLAYLADFQQDQGNLPLALATTERALEQWGQSREQWAQFEATFRTRLGTRLAALGRIDEAIGHYAHAMARVEQLGLARGMTGIGLRNQWGFAAFMAGDAQGAASLFEKNLTYFAEDKKDGPPPAVFIFTAGQAALDAGQLDTAAARLAQAVRVADAQGDKVVAARARCMAAQAALRSGDAAAAQRWWAQVTASPALDAAPRPVQVGCTLARAELAVQAARPGEAVTALDGLLASSPPLPPHLQVAALTERSKAHLAIGKRAAALADAQEALRQAQALQGGRARSFRTEAAQRALASVERATP